jgi:hypothetical protein
MVQRRVIVRGATNQALDELDAADIPDLAAAYEAAGGIATHAADTSSVHGITDMTVLATDAEVATAISDHAAAADPHPTYETAAEVLAQIGTHEGLANPHPGYLTPAEGDAAYQPLDSDLTAIAALSTTAFGRTFLDLADAAAGRTKLGLGSAALSASGDFQPVDADLTAIAALTTTAFGRGLLALADAAALAATHSHEWVMERKNADESKNNSATVADDSELSIPLLANTNYDVRLVAFWLTNATADLKYRLVFTGTTTRVRRRVSRTATTDIAITTELKTAFDSADVVLSTTGLNPWLDEEIILQVGASGGNLKLQWAQVTSGAGPTTCLEGSYLEYAVT